MKIVHKAEIPKQLENVFGTLEYKRHQVKVVNRLLSFYEAELDTDVEFINYLRKRKRELAQTEVLYKLNH
jgi:hypothetical protein